MTTNNKPDSPENILKEYQLATRHAFIPDVLESHKQHALTKLDEYYANKFLDLFIVFALFLGVGVSDIFCLCSTVKFQSFFDTEWTRY